MPEPRIVPPGRTLAAVPMPADALEDILLRARRRRAQRTAVAGSAGVMALVLVGAGLAATGFSDAEADRLRIGPATTVTTSPTPSPEPALALEQGVDAAPAPDEGRDAAAPVDGPAQAGPAAADAPAAPVAGAAPQPLPRAKPSYDPDALRSNDETTIFLPPCDASTTPPSNDWCLAAMADTSGQELSLTVCRGQQMDPGELRWRTSQQVRFAVKDATGRVVWTYDPQVRLEPSSSVLAGGSCTKWSLPWRLEDEQGQPLPDGEYVLSAASTATTLADQQMTQHFRIGANSSSVAAPATPTCHSQDDEAGRLPGCAAVAQPERIG